METTEDAFFERRIRVRQHREGYRFSIDAVILAHYAAGLGTFPGNGISMPPRHILDLGTGCGIIPLIIAFRRPADRITGVEIQDELARLAEENVQRNGMADRITILHKDLKHIRRENLSAPVDLVVSNPPYRRPGSGRLNVQSQRAVARHEICVALPDVIRAAARTLDISGRFAAVFPAERLVGLFLEMQTAGIEPKFLRLVHSRRDTGAKLALVEGMKGARPGLSVSPALVIYRENGSYTEAATEMFRV